MRWIVLAALPFAWSNPVFACDCRTLVPSSPNYQRDLEEVAAYYAVAADGVVERDGDFQWRLRVTRELKGPGLRIYRIVLSSDCSIDPQEMNQMIGKTVFLLLTPSTVDGMTDAYEAGRCFNAQSPAVAVGSAEAAGGPA